MDTSKVMSTPTEIDFEITELEYKECSGLIRDTIKTFAEIGRTFIYFNAILVASVALLLRSNQPAQFIPFVIVLSVVGIVGCIATVVTFSRALKYFWSFLARAEKIEKRFGGKLFTDMKTIELGSRRSPIKSFWMLLVGFSCLLLFWVWVLTYVNYAY